jgi:4-hydroxybenzoate polyprenyltransferase
LIALRPWQWSKNGLVVLPMLLAHEFDDTARWRMCGLAFSALCCGASAMYVINDLRDLDADRRHPDKRRRPFASGALKYRDGVLLTIALLLPAAALAGALPGRTPLWIAGYLALSFVYSLALKRWRGADILALAVLYVVRLQIGGAAAEVSVSGWLLAFAFPLFMGLALIKRQVELSRLEAAGGGVAHGRGYRAGDTGWIRKAARGAGWASLAMFAVYILRSREAVELHARPGWLWGVAGLLAFWHFRLWRMADRNRVNQDPVIFALTDPVSLGLGLLSAALVALAI